MTSGDDLSRSPPRARGHLSPARSRGLGRPSVSWLRFASGRLVPRAALAGICLQRGRMALGDHLSRRKDVKNEQSFSPSHVLDLASAAGEVFSCMFSIHGLLRPAGVICHILSAFLGIRRAKRAEKNSGVYLKEIHEKLGARSAQEKSV